MKRLINILYDLQISSDELGDKRLIDDGVLDSMDIVTLVTEINDCYDIEIEVEDIVKENFNSIDAIISLIRRRGGEVICP